jgi:hypothetical protein
LKNQLIPAKPIKQMSTIQQKLSLIFVLLLTACQSPTATLVPIDDTPNFYPTVIEPTATPPIHPLETQTPTEIPKSTSTPAPLVPNFDHIVVFVLENKDYEMVIGSQVMPVFNKLANQYTLLTQFHAITHPSLPNYIAMMGGDTFGITSDCTNCFINEPSLPDLIEASGRTWKTYQEDMPSPCYIGNKGKYYQKHNPFVYFDPIRLDQSRCEKSIVPLTEFETDIEAGTLPNFMFFTPNICNDSHNCSLDATDEWLTDELNLLVPALNKTNDSYLIILTFDEGKTKDSCCGLPEKAGGRIATVLLSTHVQNGFQDDTPYSQYSILKTISASWGLPYLGHAADDNVLLITSPWK